LLPSRPNKGVKCIADHLEIERRFLVDAREEKPWRDGAAVHAIEQHYGVSDHIEKNGGSLRCDGVLLADLTPSQLDAWKQMETAVGRLRKRDEAWYLTFKSRIAAATALELEWEISREAAASLMVRGPYPSVEKTRYVWEGSDGHVWEVDEFEGALAGLVLAEVELDSADEPLVVPGWVGHEITGLASWSNRALAQTLEATVNKHEQRFE
jgi:CYTH domain-containing protein